MTAAAEAFGTVVAFLVCIGIVAVIDYLALGMRASWSERDDSPLIACLTCGSGAHTFCNARPLADLRAEQRWAVPRRVLAGSPERSDP